MGKTVTAHGNAQIDTAQSKFGGASGLFDGTGDYLSTGNSADWNFGTGDFTIDFWVRRDGDNNNYNGLVSGYDGSGWVVYFSDADNKIRFYDGVAVRLLSGTIPNLTWTHITVVRNGNSLVMYVNGTSVATYDCTGATINSGGTGLVVGRQNTNVNDFYFKGWLDELRISKGVARWTSNFTPPTEPYTPDSYTKLLLHMDGDDGSTTFIDTQVGPQVVITSIRGIP